MHVIYAAAYGVSAVVCAVIARAAWLRRPAPGAFGLALLCAGEAWWSAAYGLQLVLSGDGPSLFWLLVRFVGLQLTPAAILVLVLEYTGRSRPLRPRTFALLAVEPTVMYLLALTDRWHGLYLGGNEPAFTLVVGGPAWWLNVAYSYAVILTAATLLVAHLVKRRAYRLQSAVLFGAVMLPVAQFLAQVAGIRLSGHLNAVPFTYTITGIVFWYALTKLGLFRVIPVAREQLVEHMPEGIVVFDAGRLIADINPAAMRMTGAGPNAIGKTADEAFPDQAEAIAILRAGLELDDRPSSVRSHFGTGGIMEVSASVVRGGDGERIATLVTLRDITEQVRAATALQERSEQLGAALERSSRILEAMTDGVLLADARGLILSGNPAAEDILGARAGHLEGRYLDDMVPTIASADLAEEAVLGARPVATTVTLPDRRVLAIEVIPLLAAGTGRVHTLFVIRDETERLAAERMQRDFVANAAHELQTPLTGLSLLAETIPRALSRDPERVAPFVERLGMEIGRLVRMTNELMALSRMDAPEEDAGPVDLPAVVADEVEDARALAAAKRQTLTLEAPDQLFARVDESDLGVIVGNLVDNAVRYTHEGGSIAVRVCAEDAEGARWAVVRVADDGPGIPPEDQDRIFERFYRVDKSRSSQTGGAGLGLSIVRGAAERNGGSVSVASDGEGATFTLRLPLV